MGKMLTIAIPTFNRISKLKVCLEHIIEQVNEDVEVLVSDNASTDGTEIYMQEIIKNCPWITYLRNKNNLGPDRNFLNCFEKASGKYVWLIGDDDFVLPGAVDSVITQLKKEPVFMHLNTCGLVAERPFQYGNPRFTQAGCMEFTDRNEMLSKIGIHITFVSSLVFKTELIHRIEDKEQYIGTFFLQSHIALRTMETEGKYIINTFNCLASSPNFTVGYDLYFVWFECFHNLLMKTGIVSGFQENALSQTYYDAMTSTVMGFVLYFRRSCRSTENRWEKECVYNALTDYPDLLKCFRVLIKCPVTLLPVLRIFYKVLKKLKKMCRKYEK